MVALRRQPPRAWARALQLALALLAAAPAAAQPERAELQVKAAFLYKFGEFVEWPASAFAGPDGAFRIGVLGAEAMAEELERVVKGRVVRDREIVVQRVRRGEPLAGLHVLFIGRAEAGRMAEVAAAAKGRPLLLVTEFDEALAQGSMINFVAAENRVRFDVAVPQAERGQLRISARLLGVARKVTPG